MVRIEDDHYEVAIIGAGLSGLAAGIRAALYGKKTIILERHNAIGGLNSFYSIAGRKYDVGLHAVTNFVSKETKGTPLTKLFKQLRIPRDAFNLSPQTSSRTAFSDVELKFSNDIQLLKQEIATHFPHQVDPFEHLIKEVESTFNNLTPTHYHTSGKQHLASIIQDPSLRELLLLPLLYYGSSEENDVNWAQFSVLFKSIYLEGFARPFEGVRLMLRVLKDKFKELGGIRKMKCGVQKILAHKNQAKELLLDNGQVIQADTILSCAGLPETLRMCSDQKETVQQENIGTFSFAETTAVFPQQPKDLGWNETIVFYCSSPTLSFQAPKDLIDTSSGVICIPNNYQYSEDKNLPEGILRVTALANYQNWAALPKEEYNAKKQALFPKIQKAALQFLPKIDETAWQSSFLATDMFTPTTVKKYTGHINGTIYGATQKNITGKTHLNNLHIIGTDQGYLGIIGAMISGITVANGVIMA